MNSEFLKRSGLRCKVSNGAAMQSIVVCAQDPVLAKKVRFLMERDECKVEILGSPADLEARLNVSPPTLLVLSRELGDGDAIERLGGFDPGVDLPPVLVLGGEPRVTAPFIHLISEPVDTQAIYREASRLLQAEPDGGPNTEVSEPIPSIDALSDEHDIGLATDGALSELADELEALDGGEIDEKLAGTFAALEDESTAMEEPSHATTTDTKSSEDASSLDPAAFARALHQTWSGGQQCALVVDVGAERLSIHFEEGRPIAVLSSLPGDLFGQALVDRGRLTQAQYADAAKRSIERGARLAESILDLGFLDEAQIGEELGTSARERLVSCFEVTTGSFWLDDLPESRPPSDRPYRLEVGHIIAQGLRSHASDPTIDGILGEDLSGYFRLRRPGFELQKDFPLSKADLQFLEFEGRAYNVEDAADGAGLALGEARRLLAILAVCEEVEPFAPSAKEFEARIREERETRRVLESKMPASKANGASKSAPVTAAPSPATTATAAAVAAATPETEETRIGEEDLGGQELQTGGAEMAESRTTVPEPPSSPFLPPAPTVDAAGGLPAPTSTKTPSNGVANGPQSANGSDTDIPPMPLPPSGEGVVPRPLAYAKPLPRGPDGSLLDTPERAISREHFQNGVNLLGKGHFSSAEEHFRDAVALCSEEHVYLIGLARAIYYNPNYRADGKLPVLRSIVDRAKGLAPDDKRVSTLETWVTHAEELSAAS